MRRPHLVRHIADTHLLTFAARVKLYLPAICAQMRLLCRDMADTYLPAFEQCAVAGRAASVMCSYNKVNEIPACASKALLTNQLRDQWGYEGFVVSDLAAIELTFSEQHYSK